MINLNERFTEKKNFFNRLLIIYVFFGFLFFLFLYRTFALQVSSYADYELASIQNKTKEILLKIKNGALNSKD